MKTLTQRPSSSVGLPTGANFHIPSVIFRRRHRCASPVPVKKKRRGWGASLSSWFSCSSTDKLSEELCCPSLFNLVAAVHLSADQLSQSSVDVAAHLEQGVCFLTGKLKTGLSSLTTQPAVALCIEASVDTREGEILLFF